MSRLDGPVILWHRIAATALILLLSVVARATTSSAHESPDVINDPLRWDDLVVRGVVKSVAYETIPVAEWYSPSLLQYQDEPVRVAKVTVIVKELYRGKVEGTEVVILARRPAAIHSELFFNERVKTGAEVVVTGLFLEVRSEFSLHSIFAKSTDGWSRLGETGWSHPIPLREIEDRIASVSVPSMTRESDLVIRGTVLAAHDIGEPGSTHRVYVVSVDKLFKGVESGRVRVSTGGGLQAKNEKWQSLLPFDLDEGTVWYLFLVKQDDVYVPTMGRRSAIRVNGQELFENLNVPSSRSASVLEKQVADVIQK